jgi:hypothetical protein
VHTLAVKRAARVHWRAASTLYQGRKVEAHKGHVPASGDKYIATSWILFRRAAELFGKPAG